MKQAVWIHINKENNYITIHIIIQETIILYREFTPNYHPIIGSKRLSWFYKIFHGSIANIISSSYKGKRIKTNGQFKKLLISERKAQALLYVSSEGGY